MEHLKTFEKFNFDNINPILKTYNWISKTKLNFIKNKIKNKTDEEKLEIIKNILDNKNNNFKQYKDFANIVIGFSFVASLGHLSYVLIIFLISVIIKEILNSNIDFIEKYKYELENKLDELNKIENKFLP